MDYRGRSPLIPASPTRSKQRVGHPAELQKFTVVAQSSSVEPCTAWQEKRNNHVPSLRNTVTFWPYDGSNCCFFESFAELPPVRDNTVSNHGTIFSLYRQLHRSLCRRQISQSLNRVRKVAQVGCFEPTGATEPEEVIASRQVCEVASCTLHTGRPQSGPPRATQPNVDFVISSPSSRLDTPIREAPASPRASPVPINS